MFYRIGVLKILQKFTGKHMCRNHFSIKLQNVTPLLQRAKANFATSNKWLFAMNNFRNEYTLQQKRSDFLIRATSETSNEWFHYKYFGNLILAFVFFKRILGYYSLPILPENIKNMSFEVFSGNGTGLFHLEWVKNVFIQSF